MERKDKKYKFTNKENYEDYSSGRVLYGAPNATNFPVRFSSEIFQRCNDYLSKKGKQGPYTIYDPFCGIGYSLSVMSFLHGSDIKSIIASDVDKTMIEFAEKNLSLLTIKGLNTRIEELQGFIEKYKKDSHKESLESAYRLKEKLVEPIGLQIFQFNILTNEPLLDFVKNIDIVIADLPYGKLTNWEDVENESNPTQRFLDKVRDRLSKESIVAVSFNKKQKVEYEGFNKIKAFTLGKRKVLLLEPIKFEMKTVDVVELYSDLENLGIKVWIDGGWGVDALLGKQIREHQDLDIAINQKDVEPLLKTLTKLGYRELKKDNDHNFVWADNFGHGVDIHAFITDKNGSIIGGIMYPNESLTGLGTINAHSVRCISAKYMIEFLAPWLNKHPHKYLEAISALCKKFKIEYPIEYIKFTK